MGAFGFRGARRLSCLAVSLGLAACGTKDAATVNSGANPDGGSTGGTGSDAGGASGSANGGNGGSSGSGASGGNGASGAVGAGGASGADAGSGGTVGCVHRTLRDEGYAFELRLVNTSEFYKVDFPPALMPHCIAQRNGGGDTDAALLETKCEASYLFKKDASAAPATAVTEGFDVVISEIPPEGFDLTIAKGGKGSTQYEVRGLDGTTWLAFDSTMKTVHVPREKLTPGGLASRIPEPPRVGPKRGAYLFPWYGTEAGPTGHWVHWDPNTPTLYTPEKGQYDSRDRAVIDQQMAEAKSAGLDLFVVSYWDTENPPLSDYLDSAQKVGIEISAMLETSTRSGGSPRESVLNQLTLLVDTYGSHAAWLKADDRPITFVYDRVATEIDAAPVGATGWDDWAWIASQMGSKKPIVMFPLGSQWATQGAAEFGGAFAFAANSGGGSYFTGSHGDDFAWEWTARQAGAVFAVPILPSIGRLREAADAPNFRNQWHAARSVLPDMIIVNSWNEYHESTIIEPTTAFGTEYLGYTKEEGDLYCEGKVGTLITQ